MYGEFATNVMAMFHTRDSFDWIKHFRAVNGDPDMVKLLAGGGILTPGKQQAILRDAAACPANLDTIMTLVELGVDIKAVSDEQGLTAMHYAAGVPNVEMLQYLKKMGLEIDEPAVTNKNRPVYDTAEFGHVENIRWFKRVGAMITEPTGF
jgi:ankyrin repeat protein